jgi:hypothetical protein
MYKVLFRCYQTYAFLLKKETKKRMPCFICFGEAKHNKDCKDSLSFSVLLISTMLTIILCLLFDFNLRINCSRLTVHHNLCDMFLHINLTGSCLLASVRYDGIV